MILDTSHLPICMIRSCKNNACETWIHVYINRLLHIERRIFCPKKLTYTTRYVHKEFFSLTLTSLSMLEETNS